jgi:hypothetical protein
LATSLAGLSSDPLSTITKGTGLANELKNRNQFKSPSRHLEVKELRRRPEMRRAAGI